MLHPDLYPDPDTAFPGNPGPDPIRIQGFDDQKLKKKKYLKFLLIKNCNLMMSNLQEKSSALKREHPALQNMKFLNFFLLFWVTFALLYPDPDTDPLT
jgi:hypothetical protein